MNFFFGELHCSFPIGRARGDVGKIPCELQMQAYQKNLPTTMLEFGLYSRFLLDIINPLLKVKLINVGWILF